MNTKSEEVKKYREENQCSMQVAKKEIERRYLLKEVEEAKNIEDIKIILTKIVNKI